MLTELGQERTAGQRSFLQLMLIGVVNASKSPFVPDLCTFASR